MEPNGIYVLPLAWETEFHTRNTIGKIIVLHILVPKFSERRQEDKDSEPNGTNHSLQSVCS